MLSEQLFQAYKLSSLFHTFMADLLPKLREAQFILASHNQFAKPFRAPRNSASARFSFYWSGLIF